jgi:hypothetical protein
MLRVLHLLFEAQTKLFEKHALVRARIRARTKVCAHGLVRQDRVLLGSAYM